MRVINSIEVANSALKTIENDPNLKKIPSEEFKHL